MNSIKYSIIAATCLALALVIFTSSPDAFAQSNLKIPRGSAEYKELLKEDDGKPCTTCGVVVSLRTKTQPSSSEKGTPNEPMNPGLDAGPSGDLSTAPIGIKGAAKPPKPGVIYVISVKYDNGAYGHIEQSKEPKLKKGERVRVTDGQVVPDPR